VLPHQRHLKAAAARWHDQQGPMAGVRIAKEVETVPHKAGADQRRRNRQKKQKWNGWMTRNKPGNDSYQISMAMAATHPLHEHRLTGIPGQTRHSSNHSTDCPSTGRHPLVVRQTWHLS